MPLVPPNLRLGGGPTSVYATPPKPKPAPPRTKPPTAPPATPAAPFPGYLTPQQLIELATQQAQAAQQPQIDLYRQQQEAATQRAQQNAAFQRDLAQALAQALGNVAPAVQNTYQEAGRDQSAFAKGFSDTMRKIAEGDVGQQNKQLEMWGAPQEQMLSTGPWDAAANVTYGLGGFIPAQTFSREGAAFTSAARMLPATALGQGQRQASAALYEGSQEVAGIDAELSKLIAGLPAQTQKYLADLQGQQFDYQKWFADQEYRKATLDRDDRDFEFALAKWKREQKTASRKQNFDEWYKQNSLGIRSESNQLRSIQNDRSFQVRLAQLGISEEGQRIAAERLELARRQAGKKGGLTPNQGNKLRKVAGDIARQSFQGYWALPADPNTPLTAAQLRQYLQAQGTTDPTEAGLDQFKRTYQEAFKMMLDAGVAPSEAWKALNRYWTKPGQHQPWELTEKGYPSGAGRPRENFKERNQPTAGKNIAYTGGTAAKLLAATPTKNMVGSVPVHGSQKPVRIILHTAESDGDPGALPGFWRGQGKGYGSQAGIGQDGTIARYANDTDLTYHTGGANAGSLGIEIMGQASWAREDWLRRPQQLEAVARLIAYWSATHRIPLELNPNRGITTHAEQSKRHASSEGHWDPGPGFPLDLVLARAQQLLTAGGTV